MALYRFHWGAFLDALSGGLYSRAKPCTPRSIAVAPRLCPLFRSPADFPIRPAAPASGGDLLPASRSCASKSSTSAAVGSPMRQPFTRLVGHLERRLSAVRAYFYYAIRHAFRQLQL